MIAVDDLVVRIYLEFKGNFVQTIEKKTCKFEGSELWYIQFSEVDYANGNECSDFITKSVVYSYKRSFNGFVVELTEEEAQKMAGK